MEVVFTMTSAFIEKAKEVERYAIEGELARLQVEIGIAVIMGKEVPPRVIREVSGLLLRRLELRE
jgi:hypothetical protein